MKNKNNYPKMKVKIITTERTEITERTEKKEAALINWKLTSITTKIVKSP
jgi:hypothetical protein